ncbi:hypothetical protein [Paenibacillus ihuae]|uniref:hypothetical protein n=1 Tax=Paenibacillus ihuae TaxID=1232431 RepID=UPI0006D587F8|nr:hypothetical protein [Paenibacillus ihuae]
MDNRTVYKARRPWEISLLLAFSLNMGLWCYFMINFGWVLYLVVAVIAVFLVIEGILIYRTITARTPFEIVMMPESITVKDRIIEASDIKTVFVKGYFVPVIGIRPKGNVLVPYKNCFRFENDNYIKDLTEWAEQRKIKVSHKRFMRWL